MNSEIPLQASMEAASVIPLEYAPPPDRAHGRWRVVAAWCMGLAWICCLVGWFFIALVDTESVLATGPILEKSVTPMRSFVAEPMRYGRLFLAGDAAHIVPPTGAKGLNLAVADVRVLADALCHRYATGSDDLLDAYSATCLKRVWRAQHFSWWMTTLLHTFDSDDPYGRRLQVSHLDYVTSSEAAATTLAENYVGIPW